jgi:hypothetical protein
MLLVCIFVYLSHVTTAHSRVKVHDHEECKTTKTARVVFPACYTVEIISHPSM